MSQFVFYYQESLCSVYSANSVHKCDDLRSHSWSWRESMGLFPLNDFHLGLLVQFSVLTQDENFYGHWAAVIRKLWWACRNKVRINGERKHTVNLHFTLKLKVYSSNPWPYYQRLEEDNEILNKALNKWRFSLNYEWIHAYYYRGVLMSLFWGLCQNFPFVRWRSRGHFYFHNYKLTVKKRSLIKNPIPKQRYSSNQRRQLENIWHFHPLGNMEPLLHPWFPNRS